MKKNALIKILIATMLFLGVALIAAFLLNRNDNLSASERRSQSEGVLRQWMAGAYVPIDGPELSNAIASINIQLQNPEDAEYVEQARDCASKFLRAYSLGSVEAFRSFRLPVEATIDENRFEGIKSARSRLANLAPGATNITRLVLPVPPKWAIDSNYLATNPWPPVYQENRPPDTTEITHDNFTEVMVRAASRRTMYKGYFEAFSPGLSTLRLDRETASPLPLNVIIDKIGFKTLGLSDHSSSTPYKFKNSLEAELSTGKPVLLCTFAAMVRLRAPDTYTPYFVRFYYSSSDQCFIPVQLSGGNLQKGSDIQLWF